VENYLVIINYLPVGSLWGIDEFFQANDIFNLNTTTKLVVYLYYLVTTTPLPDFDSSSVVRIILCILFIIFARIYLNIIIYGLAGYRLVISLSI